MAEEKKSKKVKLHNKGKREFELTGGIKSLPGRAIDVDEKVAKKFIKEYPRDFILYDDLVTPTSTKETLKKAEEENKVLADENAKLKEELEALKAAKTGSNGPAPANGGKAPEKPAAPAQAAGAGEKGGK